MLQVRLVMIDIQKQAQGYVVPESFTHGTSELKEKRWFYKGFTSGDMKQGDTFSARSL
jgi:predicted metalloprotease